MRNSTGYGTMEVYFLTFHRFGGVFQMRNGRFGKSSFIYGGYSLFPSISKLELDDPRTVTRSGEGCSIEIVDS